MHLDYYQWNVSQKKYHLNCYTGKTHFGKQMGRVELCPINGWNVTTVSEDGLPMLLLHSSPWQLKYDTFVKSFALFLKGAWFLNAPKFSCQFMLEIGTSVNMAGTKLLQKDKLLTIPFAFF